MSLNPLWEEVTPQCAPSKWKGTLSQCYPSPAVWVARGTTVVDLLFVEPGPIVCHIGRTRRPTQGAGGRSSCGALVGIPICRSQIPLHCKRTALPLSHRNTDIFIYLFILRYLSCRDLFKYFYQSIKQGSATCGTQNDNR